MPKKMFDIIPPKKEEEAEIKINISSKSSRSLDSQNRQTEKEDEVFSEREKIVFSHRPKDSKIPKIKFSFGLKFFLSAFVAVLVLVSIFSFVFSTKVEIKIWPKTEELFLTQSVVVSREKKELDTKAFIVPGYFFEETKIVKDEFPGSRKAMKEEKARGVVRVYNSYSTASQTWVAGTRFMSAEGKLFRSVKKAVIAGARYEGGKLVPGETDVEVIAAEPGEEYNIGPTTFSIPAFAGTSKYTYFYARSFSPMRGGLKAEVSQATEEDIEKARKILMEKAKKESIEKMRKDSSEDFIFIDKAAVQEIIEETNEPKTENFSLEMKIKTKILAFKKSDIDVFFKEMIADYFSSSGLKIKEDSLNKDYSFKSIVYSQTTQKEESTEPKEINLDLVLKGLSYADVDLEKIKESFLGKSFDEIELVLEEEEKISKIEIKPGLFWRRRVPQDINKVEIGLIID